MTTAIVAGEINYEVATVAGVLQQVRAGQIKALAIGSKQRIAQLPDTPTVDEFLPGYEAYSWHGLMASKRPQEHPEQGACCNDSGTRRSRGQSETDVAKL